MSSLPVRVLLVDDDEDDCLFFKDALREIPIASQLITFEEGTTLLEQLTKINPIPDVIFLDINLPGKDGIDCLKEIRQIASLAHLKIVIYSTAFNPNVANMLKQYGANYYIRKPPSFYSIKNIIHHVLLLILGKETELREKYVLKLNE